MTTCTHCDDTGVAIVHGGEYALGQPCVCVQGCTRCSPDDRGWTYLLKSEGHEPELLTPDRRTLAWADGEVARRYRETQELWYVAVRPCVCASARDRSRAMTLCEIPGRFAGASLASYIPLRDSQRAAAEAAQRFAFEYRRGARGLLLSGAPGVGKTHLLCAIGRHLATTRAVDVLYADASAVVIAARESERGRADLTRYRKAEVLLLDELGRMALSERDRADVESVLGARYNAGKTTVVATNLGLVVQRSGDDLVLGASLESGLGPRLASRVREMCSCIAVGGADYRRRAA